MLLIASPRSRAHHFAGPAGLAALGIIWGCTPLLIKVLVAHIPPLWLVAGRVWSGMAVVLLFLAVRGVRLPRDRRTWLHLTVLGTLGTALPWVVMGWAQQSMSSSLAAVLVAPTPATTLALAVAGRVERATAAKIGGIALALFGTLAIVGGELGTGRTPVRAIVAAVLCTVLFAFGTVYAKRFLADQGGVAVAAGQLVPAAVIMLPVALLAGPRPTWSGVPLAAWAAWVCLGAVSTGLAYGLFYAIVQRSGPTMAQLTCSIAPPVGALAGWLLLRERVGASTAAGMAVVALGVWVAQGGRLRPLRRRVPAPVVPASPAAAAPVGARPALGGTATG